MKYTQLIFAVLSGLALAEHQWTNLDWAELQGCATMGRKRLGEKYQGEIACYDELLYESYYVCNNHGPADGRNGLPPAVSIDKLSSREGGFQYCMVGNSKSAIVDLVCYFYNNPHELGDVLTDPATKDICCELLPEDEKVPSCKDVKQPPAPKLDP